MNNVLYIISTPKKANGNINFQLSFIHIVLEKYSELWNILYR